MKNAKYIKQGGKKLLMNDLEQAIISSPIDFILTLKKTENIDSDKLDIFYNFLEILGSDPQKEFDSFLSSLITKIKEDISRSTDTSELKKLANQIEPFTDIQEFSEIHSVILQKLPDLRGITINAKSYDNIKPIDLAKTFSAELDTKYEEWLNELFEEAKLWFDESDRFTHTNLYNKLSKVVFYKRSLITYLHKYCSRKFEIDYHPIYSIIRFNLALSNSPLAKVDEARPLCSILYSETKGTKIKPAELFESTKIAGPVLSHLILSIPYMTQVSNVRYYGQCFGLEKAEVEKIHSSLNKEDKDVINLVLNNKYALRVLLIFFVQTKSISSKFEQVICDADPHVDIAMIMCKDYNPVFYNVLLAWSSKNAYVFIDFLTRIKASDMPMPGFYVFPEFTQEQEQIVNELRDI